MPLRDLKFKPDQTILKVYGYGENKKIKVIRMNWLRTAGVEDDISIHALLAESDSKSAQNSGALLRI